MAEKDENQSNDAPGGEGTKPAADPKPPVTPTTPDIKVIDGVVQVDGKKYVKESDLIAAKESLQGKFNEAQESHSGIVDKLKVEVSEAQQEVAKANATLKEAQEARSSGDISADDLSKARQEAADTKEALAKSTTEALDMRRQLIKTTYKIPADSEVGKGLDDKTAVQLDALEEALKALQAGGQGPGNYALGGGSGGATPMTDMERARKTLDATPIRGVRNTPGDNS